MFNYICGVGFCTVRTFHWSHNVSSLWNEFEISPLALWERVELKSLSSLTIEAMKLLNGDCYVDVCGCGFVNVA